jgi:HTH-type transcriptional regulator, sugar sensing transcriptional regulator
VAKQPKRATDSVEALGFTSLEALVYVELLRAGPQSGYRIAQLIGRAPANAYKTLDSLVARGAVLASDRGTKVYRAVPFEQVAAALSSEFARRSRDAQAALARLEPRKDDDAIYQIVREDQALEQARALIAAAEDMLLVDAFPKGLAELSESIAAAVGRGVRVAICKYRASPPIEGAIEAMHPSGEESIASWGAEYIGVVADGSSMIVALVAEDGTTSGIATSNRHVAYAYYAGLYHVIRFTQLAALARATPTISLAQALERTSGLIPTNFSRRPRPKRKSQ